MTCFEGGHLSRIIILVQRSRPCLGRNMPKLYALALNAEKQAKYETAAAHTLAEDAEGAKKLGLEAALKFWPVGEGWNDHKCSVAEIAQIESGKELASAGRGTARNGFRVISPEALDQLSKADPSNIQAIAASQIHVMNDYYTLVLHQADRSFWGAWLLQSLAWCSSYSP